VRGRVVAAQTGAPLRRAQVSLLAVGGPGRRTATTDGDGRYEFADLPAGFYNLNASKAGFVGLQYGQQRPTEIGRPISVADGQRLDGIDFSLPRGAVIAVRITDDFGDPLAGAQVQVQRYQYGQDGQRRLMMAGTASFGMNATDDRGELRMYGLTPGEYFVSATYRNQLAMPGANANDSNEGFSPTFYPGTVSATEAQGVSVVIGEEVSVQFALATARLARISGTVVDSQGRPAAGAQVQIMSLQGGTITGGGGGGQVAPDGTFSLAGVAPGEHSLEVRPQFRPGGPGPSEEFGSLPIVVSGADITGLRIVTGRGATISGRVVFEGSSPRTNPNNPTGPNILRVFANQTDQTRFMGAFPSQDPLTNGTIQDNGTFQIAGMSGRVFLTVSTPGMWAQKSVTLDGQDVTDEPIDLTGKQSITGIVIRMTDKLTRVTGRVSDARGESPRECWLVFQPAEQKDPLIVSRWLRLARCTAKGSFETRGLRPGRYLVTAIESMEQGRQFVPEFREQLRRGAQEFSVNEGGSVTLDLKLTPGL
jgi:protocatechuate 3,4-dioxygenase beta subunit